MKTRTLIQLALISLSTAFFGAGCLGPDAQGDETDSLKMDNSSTGNVSASRTTEATSNWTCTMDQAVSAQQHMAENHPGCVMTSCNYNSATGYIVYGYMPSIAIP